ncbi:SdpI family protein [Aequorivita todarodis]|uniref:SdpI family protein n=1 Tax=Aequorivita todarodis TaxID=2036821 RepID=UPI00234FE52B|nr:SdpI family protein [Aequorivita todarodis]MDC8000375.1 SdpI family protein [Aequorivita todarodis]
MQFNFKKEFPLILITIIPGIFLWYVWNSLPPEVPLHWNISGEVDRYGSKNELIWLTTLVPIFLYVLFMLVPLIDPKKKIAAMGGKFYTIRFFLTLFLSVIFTFIIYSVKEQTLTNPNYLFIIIGVFYVVLGNYFKTIKPNYFIGIRTPWALENETIWKSTHRLAGKLWVAGGLLIIITCFLFKQQTALTLFLIITAIITLIPVTYSYLQFKNIQKEI